MSDSSLESIVKRHNVQVWGKGSQPMLFAHGLGCDQNVWRYITPAFENDYKIIAFDYIGSGKSDWSAYDKEKYSSLKGYAADIEAICSALNLQDIIFVGHSVSSMIGLLASLATPTLFKNLIMIGPSPCYLNEKGYIGGFERAEIETLLALMKKNFRVWAGVFAPQVMGNSGNPKLSEDLKNSLCSADTSITLDFAQVTFLSDNRKDLSKLNTPSLILQMAEDIVAPLSVGAYMNDVTPCSTLAYMKATGHFPQLSAPQETINIIKAYLARE